MQLRPREMAALEQGHEEELDPQPETNVAVPPGTRVAAELALGPGDVWATELVQLARWPVGLVVAYSFLVDWVPWARPSVPGLALAAIVAVGSAWMIARSLPRTLARIRRVPLVLVALATGGLGACVGAASAAMIVATSPSLRCGTQWLLGGASFGLAYAGLLFVPFLFARLGRMSRSMLGATHAVVAMVATVYAAWNATL